MTLCEWTSQLVCLIKLVSGHCFQCVWSESAYYNTAGNGRDGDVIFSLHPWDKLVCLVFWRRFFVSVSFLWEFLGKCKISEVRWTPQNHCEEKSTRPDYQPFVVNITPLKDLSPLDTFLQHIGPFIFLLQSLSGGGWMRMFW